MTPEEITAEINNKLNVYDNGITAPMLSTLIGVSVERVRKLLRVGVARELYATSVSEGKTLYFLAGKQKFVGKLTPHKMVNIMAGTYDGAELKPSPGITDDRFDAYRLPSRMGSMRVWRDGRTEKVEEAV